MDTRYSTGKEPFRRLDTEELREEFLIQNVFVENDVTAVYSHIDRIVTMGAFPTTEEIRLDKNIEPMRDFGVDYFLERREIGIINIGGKGIIKVDGDVYELNHYDALYLPKGTKEVLMSSILVLWSLITSANASCIVLVRVSTLLIWVSASTSDEDEIVLVHSSSVGAAVRPLLVISSHACAGMSLVCNLISHVRW